MKKLLAILFAGLMLLSLYACGKGSETKQANVPNEAQTKVPTEQALTDLVDAINMEESGGSLVYLGYEFVPEDFYLFNASDGFTAERTVVVRFAYTNNEDAEKTPKKDYTIKGYQNGAEMYSPQNWNRNYSLEALENNRSRKTVIQDGTIEVGYAFIIKDDSPLTITATYNGETKQVQKMSLTLEEIPPVPTILVRDRSELFGEWVGVKTGHILTLSDSNWEFSYKGGIRGRHSSAWSIVGNRLTFGSQSDYDFKIVSIDNKIHLVANENGRLEEFTDDFVRK